MSDYKDKNKNKGKDGYSNRSGLTAIANLFGGMVGKAVKSKAKKKQKLDSTSKGDY